MALEMKECPSCRIWYDKDLGRCPMCLRGELLAKLEKRCWNLLQRNEKLISERATASLPREDPEDGNPGNGNRGNPVWTIGYVSRM